MSDLLITPEEAAREIFGYDPATQPAPRRPLQEEDLTDTGNADFFVARWRDDVLFVPGEGWFFWSELMGCWRKDESHVMIELAKEAARSRLIDAAKESKKLAGLAIRSFSESRLRAMVTLASSDPHIVGTPDQLDANPLLLNFQNGTVYLPTGELRQHRRANYITHSLPYDYDHDAKLDLWERIIRAACNDDAALTAYVQRAFGYTLTGLTAEDLFFFIYGPGATSKTTITKAFATALGSYAATVDFESFLVQAHGGGPRHDLARLRGKRLALSVEVADGRRFAAGLVKLLTGGDRLVTRHLYRSLFEYIPQFKLWLVANHAPKIDADDDALMRRIARIPFEHVIPPAERDPAIKRDLCNVTLAGPAIMAWAVKGCIAWHQHGLAAPDAVKQSTQSYHDENDLVGTWINEHCVLGGEKLCGASDLFSDFKAWCDENRERGLTQTAFGLKLRERGFAKEKMGPKWLYRGIGLVGDHDRF